MQLSHCLRYGDVGSLSTIHPTHMDVPALFRIYLISGIVIFPVKPIMFSCQSRLSFNFSQYPAVCLPFFALPPVCNAPVSTPDLYGYARRTQRGQRAESRTIWPITIKNKHPLWIFQILTVVNGRRRRDTNVYRGVLSPDTPENFIVYENQKSQ